MIRVAFDPDALDGAQRDWLTRWQAKAARALAGAQAEARGGARPDVERRGRVWREFKQWLLEQFLHEKCGYCEGGLRAQTRGAAEHWRPKAGLRDDTAHEGYWWLAFAWENLVPACPECNAVKRTQFPIAGERAFAQADAPDVDALDLRERPLLLHPFRGEDPADHIGFDERGWAYARDGSPHGEHTIRVLDLNRWGLVHDRVARQQQAREALAHAIGDYVRGQRATVADAMVRYTAPDAHYSSAVNAGLRAVRAATVEELLPQLN